MIVQIFSATPGVGTEEFQLSIHKFFQSIINIMKLPPNNNLVVIQVRWFPLNLMLFIKKPLNGGPSSLQLPGNWKLEVGNC